MKMYMNVVDIVEKKSDYRPSSYLWALNNFLTYFLSKDLCLYANCMQTSRTVEFITQILKKKSKNVGKQKTKNGFNIIQTQILMDF